MNLWFHMIHCRLLICLLSGILAFLSISSPAATEDKRLIITVPEGIDTAKLTVVQGMYGRGLSLGEARKISPTRYSVQLYDWTTAIKLLIHHPEYKVIAAEIDPQTAVSKPYVPEFTKATMVPLTIRVVNTSGKPIASPIRIGLSLSDWKYFNYVDGVGYWGKIANGFTDADGKFSTRVPSILDDPYCQAHGIRHFTFRLTDARGHARFGYDVLPQPPIPAQRSYADQITLTIRYHGRLRGTVDESFINKHGIADRTLTVFVQRKGAKGASGRIVRSDGSFGIDVSPGSYDLTVEWKEGEKSHRVKAKQDVVVGERENKVVLIK